MSSITAIGAAPTARFISQRAPTAGATPAAPAQGTESSAVVQGSRASSSPLLSSATQASLIQLVSGNGEMGPGASSSPLMARFDANLNAGAEAGVEQTFLANFGTASAKDTDTNGDGEISEAEYVQMMTNPSHTQSMTVQQAQADWTKMDPTGEASLSTAQYVQAIINGQ
jgi:hypothetical protein